MKSSILVPVDFSTHSFDAYQYANNLAYQLNLNLHLVNVFYGSFDLKRGLDLQAGQDRIQTLESKLRSFSHWHPNEVAQRFYPVETSVEVLTGSIVPQIVKRAVPPEFRYIVCGTRERHQLEEKWLGTISYGISYNAAVPVFLIPPGSTFKGLDRVVVGCDEHSRDTQVLQELALLSDTFNSEIHFVHVRQNEMEHFELVEKDILETLTAIQRKPLQVQMASVTGDDVVSALFNYTVDKKADALVLISERRNFLQQLIYKSITRRVVLDTHIPTIVMHV